MFDSVVMFRGTIFENGYGFIAREVMRDKELKSQAKAIYSYICSFASTSDSGKKVAFPSIELQCDELGMSEDTYFKHRKPLIEKGYLQIEKAPSENGKFTKNLYVVCMKPEPIFKEPEPISKQVADNSPESKDPEETIPEKLGYGQNVDLEGFSPYPKNSGMESSPYPNSSGTVNSGTKTKSLKTKNLKDLVSIVSNSEIHSIDEILKKLLPEAPLEEIKNQMLEDAENGVVQIKTAKQYKSLLEYRLGCWDKKRKSEIRTKPAQFKPKRKKGNENLPEWFPKHQEGKTQELDNKTTDISEEEKIILEIELLEFKGETEETIKQRKSLEAELQKVRRKKAVM